MQSKFNFLTHRHQPTEVKPKINRARVRIRAVGKDQFEGLRGSEYIAARGLGKLQTSAQNAEAVCG
jgi:hypothetical protein